MVESEGTLPGNSTIRDDWLASIPDAHDRLLDNRCPGAAAHFATLCPARCRWPFPGGGATAFQGGFPRDCPLE